MPGPPSQGIFLSYRRDDTAPYALLLQQLFSEHIPDARVFRDMDSIDPGVDFAEVIQEALDSCAVLVALIGRQWATLTDDDGRPRVDNPDDYVRFEIQTGAHRSPTRDWWERSIRARPALPRLPGPGCAESWTA